MKIKCEVCSSYNITDSIELIARSSSEVTMQQLANASPLVDNIANCACMARHTLTCTNCQNVKVYDATARHG